MDKTCVLRLFASVTAGALVVGVVHAGGASFEERARAVVVPTTDFSKAERFEALSAGAATSRRKPSVQAFSHGSANLSFEQELDFKLGNALFRRLWVSAPSSTQASDGLGPLFNARSCQRCHLKDGRGHPPSANPPEDNAVSLLIRLSIPPRTEAERELIESGKAGSIAEPTYGGQLQDFALPGHDAEGQIYISYEDVSVELADGTVVNLRKPLFEIKNLKYGPLHPEAMLSPRVAPQMIGLGLLEMISEQDLRANADPEDQDGNGISGRVSRVWDVEKNTSAIGRFGWKAGTPSLRQQSAAAFNGDIGISTPLFKGHWGDCTAAQKECLSAHHGNSPQYEDVETGEEVLRLVVNYSGNLAVPARRRVDDPDVLRGKQVFYESGCVACHVPKYVTRNDPERPEHSRQLIWPYTDLLLHDMGEGLADNRPGGTASGREWRTPPLWGIGLTETVNGHTFFLHDGRARNLLEAVLWHGGEAAAARDRVRALPKGERDALIAFLNSL